MKIRTTLYITYELYKKLKMWCVENDVNISEQIEDLVKLFLMKHEEHKEE